MHGRPRTAGGSRQVLGGRVAKDAGAAARKGAKKGLMQRLYAGNDDEPAAARRMHPHPPSRKLAPPEDESDEDDADDSDANDDSDEEQLSGSGMESEEAEEEAERESSQDDDLEASLADQVADVPFEVLEALRQDGSGPSGKLARDAAKAAMEAQKKFHRANRHRPSEMSSKKPVSRFKDVIQVTKRAPHDPRFEDLNSKGKKPRHDDYAERNFKFLYDQVIPEERKALKEKLKREKNPKFKARIQAELSKLDTTARAEEARRRKAALAGEMRAKEKAAVAAGKKPYFMKKSEQRKAELVAKYEELKKGNQLDKFMEKRRKKNAAKDHRYVPSARRGQDSD